MLGKLTETPMSGQTDSIHTMLHAIEEEQLTSRTAAFNIRTIAAGIQ